MRLPWVDTGPRFPSMLAAERKIDHKEFHKTLNNLEKSDSAFGNIIFFSFWYLVRAKQPLKDLAKANKAIKTPIENICKTSFAIFFTSIPTAYRSNTSGLVKNCYWSVIHYLFRVPIQIRPSSFLFQYWPQEKGAKKALKWEEKGDLKKLLKPTNIDGSKWAKTVLSLEREFMRDSPEMEWPRQEYAGTSPIDYKV